MKDGTAVANNPALPFFHLIIIIIIIVVVENYIELADRTREKNIAPKRRTARIILQTTDGREVDTVLEGVFDIALISTGHDFS
ncbi:hypothetical protein HOLleu_20979 [Holothuria leucospilota]|uniref:Uncharacterized protein n=1 Tax=Holothuria leucospilota TaxID=206669 RepID=A0A9Q1H6I0_HOLLE|nr:hypothetical protein HOLleu_20979 [Holothuria leucospilota]